MAVSDYSATVTLTRGGIDTITTVEVKSDGTVTERTRVIPLGPRPEHELTDEQKRSLAQALQEQLDANGDTFDAPAIDAVIVQLGGQPRYARE